MAFWNRSGDSTPEPAEPAATLRLELDTERNQLPGGGELRDDLSAVMQTGRFLWVASDETASLERLAHRGGDDYGEHRGFPLRDLFDLPGDPAGEVDVEGMAWEAPYLWIVGSHSLKRKKPRAGDSERKRIKRLRKVSAEANRSLLARIPLRDDGEGGWVPVREMGDATAARLRGEGSHNPLTEALGRDRHFSPFLGIPGKDNGFDVEGLAMAGERLFLGLRGPVLRGWAAVLEVEPHAADDGYLDLAPIGRKGRPFRKHFLDLGGLGVRELTQDGDDLLVLAGPTMDLDGPVEVYRWRGGTRTEADRIVERGPELERILRLPYGQGDEEGLDHAEGLCTYVREDAPPALLVVYDSPSPRRREGGSAVRADLFEIPR